MATEHRVMSFIPYLQSPPTHTQTGSAPASTFPSSADLTAAPPKHSEDHTTTDSLTDPYGPRRWNSQMVELSGKGRALNEFSVERLGEEVEESGCASASPSTIDTRPRSLLRALNLRRGEVVFWAENRRLTSRGRS